MTLFVRFSTEDTEVSVSKGWIRAHNTQPLPGGLIQPHIDTLLAASAWDRNDLDLRNFEENALAHINHVFYNADRPEEVKASLGLLHQVAQRLGSSSNDGEDEDSIERKVRQSAVVQWCGVNKELGTLRFFYL